MPNIPMTLLLHVALLFAGVALLRLSGRQTALRPLLLGLGVLILYWIVSPLGLWAQNRIPGLSSLHWNWLGKLFAIAVALLYWRVTGLSREEIGLTWRQRSGSLIPAIVMILLLCAISWGDEALMADGRSLSAERLVFQAVMPGLDEELVFRGLMLAFFARAFGAGREIAGARFGIAGLAASLLFAAGHGLFIAHGELVANWRAIAVTGTLGAGFLWLRTRTGSLVAPTFAHNLCNFGNSFF